MSRDAMTSHIATQLHLIYETFNFKVGEMWFGMNKAWNIILKVVQTMGHVTIQCHFFVQTVYEQDGDC